MGCSQSAGQAVKPVTVPPEKAATGGLTKAADDDKQAAEEENKGYQQTMQFLSQVQLLRRLPKDEHPQLAAACLAVEIPAGETVIKQGDAGSEFYVIKAGEADVSVARDGSQPLKVATLKPGDYFGENALLRDEPRTATITAKTDLSLLKITREKFQELGLHEKLQFANRKAVGGGNRKVAVQEPSPKEEKERELIAEALLTNQNLRTMVTLDDQRVKQIIDVVWKEEVPSGKELIVEGDWVADYFYIVQDGSFEVFVTQEGDASHVQSAESALSPGDATCVSTIGKGGSFGELALLYLVPRAATVRAVTDSVVWVIDRMSFKSIVAKVSDEKVKDYVKYLDRVELLDPLLADEKLAVAQALVEMHFEKDDVILRQGEPGTTFYIMYEGEVAIIKDGAESTRLEAKPSANRAQVFGERALLNVEPRAATVQVTSDTAKAFALDQDSFNLLLGPLSEIIHRGADAQAAAGKTSAPKGQLASGEKILRKDLTRIGLLGCGGFGAVELWQHSVTGNTYALKGLSKGFIVKTGMQEGVMNEKNILMMTNSPFIIKLHATYNGSQTVYFLLEPALGGELYATYNRKGFHGSVKHAKYYVAGVVLAFEHFHERHIIYRDLKPENLLFDEAGHLKVTDMGLAKFVVGKTFTTCGTPDYFAPEVVASTGHTNAVDWWTVGILLFELLTGHAPFESAYPMQTYSKVMKGISKVPFPPSCQGDVEVLIKGLLHREPCRRLPMKAGGTQNIKGTPWYAGFDWAAMQGLELEPPYKPVVRSKRDIANFSARKEDMPKYIEYKDDGSGWDKDFAT